MSTAKIVQDSLLHFIVIMDDGQSCAWIRPQLHLFMSESWRRSSDSARLPGSAADNTLMDRCFHTVVHFQVKLGQLVLLVCASLLDVSKGRCVHNIADNETLDRLVLRNGLASRNASDTLDMSTSLLIASVIAAFDCHAVEGERNERGQDSVRKTASIHVLHGKTMCIVIGN